MTAGKHQVRARDVGAAVATGHSSTEFAAHRRPEATTELTHPVAGWDTAVTEPTHDQVARARGAARRTLMFRPGATAADLEELTRQKALVIADQEAAYHAWKNGEPHPDDQAYGDIWAGNAAGVSRADVERKLADALAARTSNPTPGPGRGYRNTRLAQEHLDERIALYREALECEGRNLSVNQANVRQQKRWDVGIPF
ncbi:hypothetical protein [Curtobacterium sp. MCBD17_040]|uniref:hypothetical protein n=1 Tax=Curtobacterium sp. MCBD17_040 TaxID=2175674 RepID=UPI000DA9CE8E|nr:hypothetical protein [Curtobacterium sp. MCBD17_040]WIB65500.1 hypothetical protein DEI94_19190 [Curtobacterium sp. MCBD17_040]